MIRVAVDAMGGDRAPETEVAGAVQALAATPEDVTIQLVGRPAAIEAELARHPGADRSRLELHEAADVIGMAEKPLAAVRKKPNSSLVVGLNLHKSGRADAFLSAGNTGATLAASTVLLGLHDGVERATVATLLPTGSTPVVMLDAGANLDCSPRELVGFAYLGTVYMRDLMGIATPVVGLLNVGEEEEKGTAIVREAHQLLKQAPRIQYAGNIEGRDILPGPQQRIRCKSSCATGSWATSCSSSTSRRLGCSWDCCGSGSRRLRAPRDAGPQSAAGLLDLRWRAPPRRARHLHHLPRLVVAHRHQERDRRRGPRRARGLSQHIATEFATREPAAPPVHDRPSLRRGGQRRQRRP